MRPTLILLSCWLLLPAAASQSKDAGQVIATDAIQPHAAVDREGNIYAVFLQRGNVAVAVSTDRGKTFSAPVVAIDAGGKAHGGHQRGPRIGVDAKKNLVVACPLTFDAAEAAKKYPVADLYLATSADGGKTWTKPLCVNEATRKAPEGLHWLAVAPEGTLHLAWLDMRERNGRQDLYYATVREGKIGKNRKLIEEICECCAPGLTLDAKGNPFLAYREGGKKASRELFVIRSDDGGVTFSKPVRINSANTGEKGCPMSAPAVAVAQDGKRFVAAWMDSRNGKGERDVFWTTGDGTTYGKDACLHEITRGIQDHPALVFEEKGTAWIVWEDARAGRKQIWARSSATGDRERRVSPEELDAATFPSLAAGNGLLALVYEASAKQQKQVVFRLLSP